jgi:hypothetical protein
MISKICLVACAKTKRENQGRAEDLYISPLFHKYRQFAREQCGIWYILSAKYGLLEPDRIIEPYDKTLKLMADIERKQWALSVVQDLKSRSCRNDRIIILGGDYYRKHLVPLLSGDGYEILVPLEGKSIGFQLQWLNTVNQYPERLTYLERFYHLLTKLEQGLGRKRVLRECSGHMDWPQRGVYFLFEPGEMRTLNKSEPRVVRVGTHMVSRGSKGTLWNRLRTHRGTNEKGGNHRGSVFRLHVGAAMLGRNHSESQVPTWGVGSTAPSNVRESEANVEQTVSGHIGKMSVLWLEVHDEPGPTSDRAYIERNCISLLAGPWGPIDLPSRTWLGNYCPNKCVVRSGLWNVDFTDYRYDCRFLDIFEEYVMVTLGARPAPQASLAPPHWYLKDTRKAPPSCQKLLFREGSE